MKTSLAILLTAALSLSAGGQIINTGSGSVSGISDVPGLQTALDAKQASPITGTNNTFVFEGDSRTTEPGLAGAGNSWPSKLMALPLFSGKGTSYNVATSGATLANIVSEYTTQVYPHRPTANGGDGTGTCYLFVYIDANDVGSMTTATYFTDRESYITTAQGHGFTVIIITGTRGNYAQASADKLVALNKLTRAGTAANYIVDAAALFPDNADTLVYSDGLHLTAAAYARLAKEVQSVFLTKQGSAFPDSTATNFMAGPIDIGPVLTEGGSFGERRLGVSTPSVAAGNIALAVRNDWFAAANTSSNTTGISSQVFKKGSTAISPGGLVGVEATATNRGSAALYSVIGFATHIGNQTATYGGGNGAVTDLRHFVATSPITAGATEPITTAYGLYIESQKITGVTSGYSIYQAGTNDQNLFAGTTKSTGLLIAKKVYDTGTAFQIDGGNAANEYTLNIKPYVVGAYDIGYRFNMVNNFSDIGNPFTVTSAGVLVSGVVEGAEQTAPAAPAANGYKIFAVDNGSGKTVLKVQFATGAAQVIATEP